MRTYRRSTSGERSWWRSTEKLGDDDGGETSHENKDDLLELGLHLDPLHDAHLGLNKIMNIVEKENSCYLGSDAGNSKSRRSSN